MIFSKKFATQSHLRAAITKAYRMDEATCVKAILKEAAFSEEAEASVENSFDQVGEP